LSPVFDKLLPGEFLVFGLCLIGQLLGFFSQRIYLSRLACWPGP
jgi:hypothetical protein